MKIVLALLVLALFACRLEGKGEATGDCATERTELIRLLQTREIPPDVYLARLQELRQRCPDPATAAPTPATPLPTQVP